MQIRSEKSKEGFSRFAGYSHTLSTIKTGKRRRGERPSGGLYCLIQGTLVHLSAAFVLHSKLARIVAALKPLSEQNGIMKFLNNVDCADTLNGFVQDLAYAVADYQVCDISIIAGIF